MLFAFNGRATRNFLGLMVVMHFILFVDRVNLAAAAGVMQQDLGLSNLALGLAFSAFNYAYASFQLIGGWFQSRPATPISATLDAMLITDPPPEAIIAGIPKRQPRNVPNRSRRMARQNSSISAPRRPSYPLPTMANELLGPSALSSLRRGQVWFPWANLTAPICRSRATR